MSEREQIVSRLSELQAKQEAATSWGAAVGAREEEIRSLESRLLRIDSMTAPPSTPRHTATPWTGSLSVDLRKGALSVSADGLTLIDEKHVCWGIIFPDKTGNYDHAVTFTESVNSHASLTAKVAEMEAALQEINSWKDDTLGARPKEPHPYNCAPEITEAFDRGARMAFYRCAERARATLDNADGGREYDPNVAPCDDAEFGMKP